MLTEIERIQNSILRMDKELKLLKLDRARVSSNRAISLIESEIKYLESAIERKQFKLWKLEKEGEDE